MAFSLICFGQGEGSAAGAVTRNLRAEPWIGPASAERGGIRSRYLPVTKKEFIMSLIQILLCLFLPPVAVALRAGVGLQLIINIVLCFVFWLPAVIHAFWVSSKGGPEPI